MNNTTKTAYIATGLFFAATFIQCNIANAKSNDELFMSNGLTKIRVNTDYQQQNPLSVVTSISIPDRINTVGQAFNYTLQRTGYQIQTKESLPANVRNILMMEFPVIHREFQHVTVINILNTLVGPAFDIKVNHQQRTVHIVEA